MTFTHSFRAHHTPTDQQMCNSDFPTSDYPTDANNQQLAKRQFNAEVYALLQSQSPRARSLFSFIRRTLRQFHLEQVHTESEVFNEAYLRGIAYLLKGETIRHPKAWLRTTCYHIIQEWHRASQRHAPFLFETAEPIDPGSAELNGSIDLDIEAVKSALLELDPNDRLIIQLRAQADLSWKEIQQYLMDAGEPLASESALRKRGQRAMQRLRQAFHLIRPSRSTVS